VRFADLVRLSLSALALHKLRTLLTLLGVLFGSFVLVASISIRRGVQETIVREYLRFGELRQIQVHPRYTPRPSAVENVKVQGKMSAARRQRLEQELRRREQRRPVPEVGITPERLQELAALDHVRSVQPNVQQHGRVFLRDRGEYAGSLGVLPDDTLFSSLLVAGRFFSSTSAREVVVTEHLLYQLGIVNEKDVAGTLGQKLRLEYRIGQKPSPGLLLSQLRGGKALPSLKQEKVLTKVLERLPTALDHLGLDEEEHALARRILHRPTVTPGPDKADEKEYTVFEDLTLCGVIRAPEDSELPKRANWMYRNLDVVLPSQTAQDLCMRLPPNRKEGFGEVMVEVDHPDNVKEVHARISAMGLQARSLIEMIEREEFTYMVVFTAMTMVAIIALIVAALGMTNTMLMSVLERTREIGIMKAVGARDGHLKLIFLMEGALIGMTGGVLGVLAAWGASYPGDAYLRWLVNQRLSIKLTESIFVFPWWLVAGAPVFACLVTTLAAYYPARRAVRVNPITALRYE
jgi:putative ABC transport system permease protein